MLLAMVVSTVGARENERRDRRERLDGQLQVQLQRRGKGRGAAQFDVHLVAIWRGRGQRRNGLK